MTVVQRNIEVLLSNAKSIIAHQEEIKKLKGESFNVFSILKMETKENETHSAFVGELLNPKGSHLKGSLFLTLFIQAIGYKGLFDTSSALLTLEKSIGVKNDKLRMGGRIDIYLADANGYTISIENKIYAGDQETQIERYVNHNKEKNAVYYLTRNGNSASDGSKGGFEEGREYFCISYRSTMVQWLEKCLKESAEQPLLRESIKQYIILIKKITNQLTDNKMEEEIEALIGNNYRSAKVLADNIGKVEVKATNDFLTEIRRSVEHTLSDGWTLKIDDDLNQAWSGLYITYKDWNGIQIKIEGYTKIPTSACIYGIIAPEDVYNRILINEKIKETSFVKKGIGKSKGWPSYKPIFSFANIDDRSRLFDSNQRKELVNEVSSRLIELALECQLPLSGIGKINEK